MGILLEDSKLIDNISADVSVDLFIRSFDLNYLKGKAIEHVVASNGLCKENQECEHILESMRYLMGQLEHYHAHLKDEWLESPVIQYIKQLSGKDND